MVYCQVISSRQHASMMATLMTLSFSGACISRNVLSRTCMSTVIDYRESNIEHFAILADNSRNSNSSVSIICDKADHQQTACVDESGCKAAA